MAAEIVTLEHADSGATARVLVSQGFNCFSWRPLGPGGLREMIYSPEGFESGEMRPSSGGCPLLFPFPGRIAQGRFTFEGRQHEVPSGDALGNAIHGFVFSRPWRLTDQTTTHVTAEFQGSIDAPETLDYWPSDYRIRVTHRLDAGKLVTIVRYDNPGENPLPCGFGTHAYFRLPFLEGADVEQTVLTAPVDKQFMLADMIPTTETLRDEQCKQLAGGLGLSGREFDTVYGATKASGEVVTSIASGGVTLRQTFDAAFGCLVIYTPGHREAVCVEPYTCLPNPFGLEEQGIASGLTVLAPGESREHTLTLTLV